MKCPYCDEQVRQAAKFCPKCGLPLKDDATVSTQGGAYLTDEAGPARWVLLGAAGLIVVVALSVGFLNSRKSAQLPPARREPVPINPAFARAVNPAGMYPINPALSIGGLGRSSAPSVNYSPQVRWAYVPPARPSQTYQPNYEAYLTAPEPTPPPMVIAMNPAIVGPVTVPSVAPPSVQTPQIPVADTVPPPPNYPAGVVLTAPDPTSAFLGSVSGAPIAVNPPEEISGGTLIYDPVLERYVRHPERIRRSPARRNSAPTPPTPSNAPGSINPATGQPTIAEPGQSTIE